MVATFSRSAGEILYRAGHCARSYRTARTTMMVGRAADAESRSYFYQDLMLPVRRAR